MLGRFASLQLGLLCFGVGIPLMLQAHLGLPPWDVLHQGISRHTPLTIGQANEAAGFAVLLVAWAMGSRPGVGTISNMLLIGLWVDLVLRSGWLPDEAGGPLALRLAMLALALLLFGIGSGAYIAPRLGAGPRDSLMLMAAARSRRPVALVRGAIESTACLAGVLLGGTVGVGTLITALLLGPAVHAGLRIFGFHLPAREPGEEPDSVAEPHVEGL